MRKLLSFILIMGLGLGLQGCGKKPDPEESCNFVQNADLQRISWGAAPVVLWIDQSVPTEYRGAIQRAAKTWNTNIGRDVVVIAGVTTSKAPSQDGSNVIYFLNDWESDRSTEQARTTVYWTGNRIYEADIRVNDHDFDFFWGDTPVQGRVDIESLVLHEMGHVLGLAHNIDVKSVMARALQSGYLRRDLTATDLSSIRCEY